MCLTEGHIYGLVGANGSGKTTLFSCLTHQTDYQGEVLTGHPYPRIGYMPTSVFFYPYMKGCEYIEFCLAARGEKMDKNLVASLNRLFDLPLHEYATAYSTGMKKKLVFLTLLMQRNDIFLLDEPFNGLDLDACVVLKQLLLKLREQKKLILLSSHIISSLTDICDEIHYLHQHTILRTYNQSMFDYIEQDIVDDRLGQKLEEVTKVLKIEKTKVDEVLGCEIQVTQD
jgi:ABC-2 type transport system ATP-binding protein